MESIMDMILKVKCQYQKDAPKTACHRGTITINRTPTKCWVTMSDEKSIYSYWEMWHRPTSYVWTYYCEGDIRGLEFTVPPDVLQPIPASRQS